MRVQASCLLAAVLLTSSAFAQNADAVRGGWMTDVVGGVPHIYMLTIRDNVVTGTYCTDCVNMDNLAVIQNGTLDANGLRFEVHNPGPVAYTDTVTGRLVNGALEITRQRKGSSAAPVTMTLHRGQTPPAAPRPAQAGPPPARPAYVPPGPAEPLSPAKVAGLWLFGTPGPTKQHFMFKQVGNGLFGLACGPCNNTENIAPLERISIDGTTLRFSIVHESNAKAFYDKGPFSNEVRAQIAENELHLWVIPSYEPADSTPNEITLFGPIRQ